MKPLIVFLDRINWSGVCYLLIMLSLAACGRPSALTFKVEESPVSVSPELLQSVSFQEVYSEVLSKKCIACHDIGSKLRLDTYHNAVANLSKIKSSVLIRKSMPRKPMIPLSKKELELVAAWVEAKGPELPMNGSDPGGVDYTKPLEPTYQSIKDKIINVKCLTCHSAGGEVARISLETKEDLLNSSLDLIVPGNPEESGFMIVLEAGARKFMPTKESGFSPVSEHDKAMVREWILRGAQ